MSINRDITRYKQLEHMLRKQATIDELTGLSNRREMMRLLQEEVARGRRYDRPLSVIILDLDHFKKVNDTYGHLVGDQVLRSIADVLSSHVRGSDRVARYGGEEMVIVLPETTCEQARNLAQHLCSLISEYDFAITQPDAAGCNIRVTVSMGIAELGEHATTGEALLVAADRALYEAKRNGRNCAVQFNVRMIKTKELNERVQKADSDLYKAPSAS